FYCLMQRPTIDGRKRPHYFADRYGRFSQNLLALLPVGIALVHVVVMVVGDGAEFGVENHFPARWIWIEGKSVDRVDYL
ncbi:hypothetical protein PFISCL1PPCAC_16671, partial [Pristionchus fissidentatus]